MSSADRNGAVGECYNDMTFNGNFHVTPPLPADWSRHKRHSTFRWVLLVKFGQFSWSATFGRMTSSKRQCRAWVKKKTAGHLLSSWNKMTTVTHPRCSEICTPASNRDSESIISWSLTGLNDLYRLTAASHSRNIKHQKVHHNCVSGTNTTL